MPRGAIKLCGERRSSSGSSDLKNGNDKHAHNDHDDEDDEDHSHNDDHPLVPRIKYQFNGHRLMSVSAIHSLPCTLPRTGLCSLRPNPDADRSRGSPSPISMPQAAPFCQVARKEMTLAVSARGSFDAPSHSQSLSLSLSLHLPHAYTSSVLSSGTGSLSQLTLLFLCLTRLTFRSL